MPTISFKKCCLCPAYHRLNLIYLKLIYLRTGFRFNTTSFRTSFVSFILSVLLLLYMYLIGNARYYTFLLMFKNECLKDNQNQFGESHLPLGFACCLKYLVVFSFCRLSSFTLSKRAKFFFLTFLTNSLMPSR